MERKIEVINTYNAIKKYIERVKSGNNPKECWDEEVISVYWDKLCCYAPFDLRERKPAEITDIDTLSRQCDLLEKIDMDTFRSEFEKVTTILPNYDEDPITVAIFPGNDAEVDKKQNGVVGTSLFGNILIQINPLIEGYEEWIKYVFAHEYHHTVWGNYWFMLHGGELENKFIEYRC